MMRQRRAVPSRAGDLPPDADARLVPDERVEYALSACDRVCYVLIFLLAIATLGVAIGALQAGASAHAAAAAANASAAAAANATNATLALVAEYLASASATADGARALARALAPRTPQL